MRHNNIPILSPQLFVKDYFDHDLMQEDGLNFNAIAPKEQHCFFLISPIEMRNKYINFPKESIKTTYFEFIFLTEGFCDVTDNLNELTHRKSQIRFVAPSKITSVQALSADIEGFYCLFDQAFVDTYSGMSNQLSGFAFFDLDAVPILSLTDEQTAFFALILKKIHADFTNNYPNLKPIICQYLLALFKECHFYYEKTNQENSPLMSADRIAQGFIRLVNKYYLSKRKLADYADLLNITPKHLTKSVKQSTGNTPTDFIQKMLILEAKVLLKETNQSVSEIAYQLNFEDTAYFNRFFKQHTGIAPASFRKNQTAA